MEATATPYSNGATAETAPSPEGGNGIPKQTRDNGDSTAATLKKPDAVPEIQSHFESRGNLDTLVAAALKPMAEDYPQRHHSSPRLYEPLGHSHHSNNNNNNSNNNNNNVHNSGSNESSNNINDNVSEGTRRSSSTQQHTSHYSGSPSRSPRLAESSLSASGGSGLDPNLIQTATPSSASIATITTAVNATHRHSSSKYHYREQGRTNSDEDSAEDDHPSSSSRQQNHHVRPASTSEYPPSCPPQSEAEQSDSAFKSSARSSMSISSLLGDSSGHARRTGDEEDSTPDRHATTTRHLTPSPVRPNGAQSEGLFEQRCAERVVKRKLIK
ncbi:MAG: hypothetical protein J3R72DRAFT_139412 [Linnemannia gamsii]|nr:MAG: hypothetical protein J3R72DRAFT_139412 [Linnemannia gamsii]